MSQAYKYLANYHLTKKNWIDAYKYAQVETSDFITSRWKDFLWQKSIF